MDEILFVRHQFLVLYQNKHDLIRPVVPLIGLKINVLVFLKWHLKSHLKFSQDTLLGLVLEKEKTVIKPEVRALLEKLRRLLESAGQV